MKVINTIIIVLWIGNLGQVLAQTNHEQSLVDQAKVMIKAIEEEDYATYVDLVYPLMVETYGGKDILVKITKSQKDAAKEAGMVLQEATFASISKIEKHPEGQLQSIVTFDYVLNIKDNDYVGRNYLLALSDDGVTWSFVELETFDLESIKDFIPTYIDALGFPLIEGAQYREK